MHRLWMKLRTLWKRRQLEQDLEDELAFHLAMREERKGEGARRAFGNVQLVKQDLRDQWTFRAIETFWRDLRYAARMLRRSPGFTLVAVLSLAIGIGGNTAIFSVVDAILLRSLPVRDPQQLRVVLWTGRAPFHGHYGYMRNRSGVRVRSSFPFQVYQQFVASLPEFSDLIGFASNQVTVIAGAASHYADAQLVSGNFFGGLGVTAVAGRTLTPEDERGSVPVAVISYRYWEQHFGLQPEAVGQTILVNGRPVTVIGITPRAFLGIRLGDAPDLFVPMSLAGLVGGTWYPLEDADKAWVQVIGRLRPGVNDQQVLAGLTAVMQQVAGATGTKTVNGLWRPVLESGASGVQMLRDQAQRPLLVLSCVVGLVLMIACANLANLLLARGVARRREIAVRLSIGAGRWRLVRQFLTESLLLAGLGAGVGLAFAPSLASLVVGMTGYPGQVVRLDARLDSRGLLFTAAAVLVTALLFGAAPALRATRVDLTPALKDGAGSLQGSSPQLRASRLLIAGQVALSTLLLAGAGLFLRTLANLHGIDPGFQTRGLLLFDMNGSRSGYQGEKLFGLYERIREKVAVVPGIQSATLSDLAFISGNRSDSDVTIAGDIPKHGQALSTNLMRVGSTFFSTMRIPILLGRGLDDRDGPRAPKTGVVNETFARSYLAARNPVGQYLYLGDDDEPRLESRIEIVGVCRDAKYDDLKHEIRPTVYLPYLQERNFRGPVTFELRTAMPLMAIAGAVQRVVASIDRNVPVAEMRTQEDQIRETLGTERMFAGVVSSFGAIAALLAAIGLYGVMAYVVTRRTSEIGIRLALGANRGDVQWMVLRDSLWMVAAGLAVGIPAALALTKLVRASLYGIQPNDPLSFLAAGLLMATVAGMAAWIPARRAARVDPMRALRCE